MGCMADRLLPAAGGPLKSVPPDAVTGSVLVIGRADDATLKQAASLGQRVFAAPVSALDAGLLERIRPGWVVFPLLAPRFDAHHVIEILAVLGYARGVCIMAPPLPNRRMVETELRAIAPSLHLMLVDRTG